MDIGEEIIGLYYGPEHTFAEQVKQPLHVHPLFELALEKQIEFREIQTGITTQEINALLEKANTTAAELNVIAVDAGMVERPVALTGEGIQLPEVKNLVESNLVQVKTLESGKAVDELGLTQEAGGLFYGFGVRLDILENEGTIGAVKPVLVYQVKVGTFRSPHSAGTVFATGDVGTTQVEFVDDIRLREISELLELLTEHDDEQVIRAVNSMNVAFAKKEKPDAPLMRHIGYQMDRILSRDVSQVYIDGVIDFINCYLDLEKVYDASTASVLKLNRINQKYIAPVELIQLNEPIPFKGKLKQLVVIHNYDNVRGVLRQREDRSFYFVAESAAATWYIRLTDLKKFDSL